MPSCRWCGPGGRPVPVWSLIDPSRGESQLLSTINTTWNRRQRIGPSGFASVPETACGFSVRADGILDRSSGNPLRWRQSLRVEFPHPVVAIGLQPKRCRQNDTIAAAAIFLSCQWFSCLYTGGRIIGFVSGPGAPSDFSQIVQTTPQNRQTTSAVQVMDLEVYSSE